MSFPNVTDIVTTAIENRSKEIADNVTKNNALLARLRQKGRVKTVDGGSLIFQELSFSENGNFQWYSGYDQLSVAAQDVISAAQFSFKQAAVAVTISGLEELQNSGKEKMIPLMDSRLEVAESTMANNISAGVYSDGTGSGGKQIGGLGLLVVANPTTGVVGGIDSSAWSFWRNQYTGSLGSQTATTIQGNMNTLWMKCIRGSDKPDLIVADSNLYGTYLASLQSLQRFTDTDVAKLGFDTVKYMTADVVLDGGYGGFETANVMHFLNTKYLFYRPHKDRDMVPLAPNRRVAVNQDAEVAILAWAGNMTISNRFLQGYFQGS